MNKLSSLFAFLFSFLMASGEVTAQTIFAEDFESTTSSSLPTGWSQSVAPNDSVGFKCGTSFNSAHFLPGAHTKYVALNDDTAALAMNTNVRLFMPSLNLSGLDTSHLAVLKFDFFSLPISRGRDTERAWIEISLDGGFSWRIISQIPIGWWDNFQLPLYGCNGFSDVRIAFKYTDAGNHMSGIAFDNITVSVYPRFELGLASISPMTGTSFAYGLAGSTVNVSGKVNNNGADPVTNFLVHYIFNGGTTVSERINCNIPPFSNATFLDSIPITFPTTAGSYPLKVWVELAGDDLHTNDTITNDTLVTVTRKPLKQLLFEDGTGITCGWCPRGMVYLDSMNDIHGDSVNLIAVHYADTMTIPAYDYYMRGYYFTNGLPAMTPDRSFVNDPDQIFNNYNQLKDGFGFADLSIAPRLTGNNVQVDVQVTPAINLQGNYKLVMVMAEDSVYGRGNAWYQHNYYSGNTAFLLSYGGLNYNAQPDNVPDSLMVFNHVARSIIPTVNGDSSSTLPHSMHLDSVYTMTFNDTLKTEWKARKIKVIVMLLDARTGRVLNSKGMPLIRNTNSAIAMASNFDISIFPNPTKDRFTIQFNSEQLTDYQLSLTDVYGRIIISKELKTEKHSNNMVIDVSELKYGNYTVLVKNRNGTVFSKIITVAP